jgi:hypothetical protein
MQIRVGLALIAALAIPAKSHAQKNWKDSLKIQLAEAIEPTRTASDFLRITKPGQVLVVKLDGIGAGLASDNTILKNHFRDGHVEQAKGIMASLAAKKTNRDYRVGEKVYVTAFDVNDNDIQMMLVSLETSQVAVLGNTQQTRYKTVIQFDFPKDSLRTIGFERVRTLISGLFQIGEEAAPKTVEVGQSMAEVEAVMGKPESILKVGAKSIYVYKSIKVTFLEGKVADIQ